MGVFDVFQGKRTISGGGMETEVKNPSEWSSVVLERAIDSIQSTGLSPSMGEVAFSKMDEKTGTAAGSASFLVMGKRIIVPFVIANFRLKPLDVFIYRDEFFPLSAVTLAQAIASHDFGAAVSQEKLHRPGQPSLYNATNPPGNGRYLYAGGIEGFIEKHADPMEALRFSQAIMGDRDLTAHAAFGGIYSKIESMGKKAAAMAAAAEPAPSMTGVSAVFLVKSASSDLGILLGGRRPAEVIRLKAEDLRRMMEVSSNDPDAASARYLESGVSCCCSSSADLKDALTEDSIQNLPPLFELLDSDGVASTIVDGEYQRGLFIKRLIEPPFLPSQDKVFIGSGVLVRQPFIHGRKLSGVSEWRSASLELPRDGAPVIAVIPIENTMVDGRKVVGGLIAYGPFVSVTSFKDAHGAAIQALTAEGDPFVIRLSRGVLMPSFDGKSTVVLPMQTKFISVGRNGKAISVASEAIQGLADAFKDGSLTVEKSASGYRLGGTVMPAVREYLKPVEKLAFQGPFYNAEEVKAIMAICGIGKAGADKAFLEIQKNGSCGILNAKAPNLPVPIRTAPWRNPVPQEDIFKAAAVAGAALKTGTLHRYIKLAEDAAGATVDKILSLGLINDANIAKFKASLNDLRGVQKFLAGLLMASRLGFPVDEKDVSAAMSNVTKVIDQISAV